jgi:hypothetical protein
MLDLLLAVVVGLSTPDIDLMIARDLTMNGFYDDSDRFLVKAKQNNIYHLCKMLNSFQQNDRDETEKHLVYLENMFEPLPKRYVALMYLVRDDLDRWKKEDLSDIGRDMKHSGSRLQTSKAGDKTQSIQKEILRKLDDKIKAIQDKKKSDSDAEAKYEIESKNSGKTNKPADVSKIIEDAGAGKVDEKKMRQLKDNWGTMPVLEREKVINEITKTLPPKHRAMIEEYYKALNRMEKK